MDECLRKIKRAENVKYQIIIIIIKIIIRIIISVHEQMFELLGNPTQCVVFGYISKVGPSL